MSASSPPVKPQEVEKMDLESNPNRHESQNKPKKSSWNPLSKYWHPLPAPVAKFGGKPVPDQGSNVWKQLVFSWVDPIMQVGFSRPLEKEDLWSMNPDRQATALGDKLESRFYARCPPRKRPPKFNHDKSGKKPQDQVEAKEEADSTPESDSRTSNEEFSGSDEEGQVEGALNSAMEAGDNLPSTARDMEAPAVAGPGTGAEARSIGWFSRMKGEKRGSSNEEKGAASKIESKAEEALKGKRPKYDSSLALALHSVFFVQFWIAGLWGLIAQGLLVTSPLVSKALIEFLTASYAYGQVPNGTVIPGLTKPSSGRGWGLAVGLWAMQQAASFANNQYYFQAMQVGFKARSATISNIFRKALRLSAKSRMKHTTGQLTTMISADCTRLDMASGFAHQAWIGPIEIIVALALLINTMGPSALVAVAVLIFGTPIQAVIVARMINARRGAVKITDRRVRLMQEIFTGIKYIVLFSHQTPYIEKIIKLRREELYHIKSLAFYRSLTFSIVYFVPVLASTLSFITYHALGHPLDPAIIFSSLQFINVLRMPLVLFPLAASSVGDAYVALGRISTVLVSDEVLEEYSTSDPEFGLKVKGSFTWETAEKPGQDSKKKQFKGGQTGFESKEEKEAKLSKEEIKQKKIEAKAKKLENKSKAKVAKLKRREIRRRDEAGEEDVFTEDEDEEDQAAQEIAEKKKAEVFKLKDVDVSVKKGELVCVVGPLGCGKTSFLQALAGEMRKTEGTVSFGGSTAYAPQTPWIQNLSLRDNITFGLPDDQRRFQEIVSACALRQDIDMLPDGESTELGERGVTISGGQKARISLARTAYFGADVLLLDDVFSAVDSGVKRHLLHNCILNGPMAGKTRILVTHSLHVLPYADRVLYMEDGVFLEQGTYSELLERKGRFSQLIENYGTEEKDVEEKKGEKAGEKDGGDLKEEMDSPGKKLMTEEERAEGAVPLSVYGKYLQASGSPLWLPFLLVLLTVTQVATVGNNLVLGFWTGNKISGWASGQYIGLYAGFGIAQAVFTFATCFAVAYCGFYASLTLFTKALKGTMTSPLAFHDKTPLGRIISRLSKDIDTLDFQLPSNFFSFSLQFSTVLGTIGLTIYAYNYLGIMFPPLFLIYFFIQDYYRRTSREAKRLDSLLRSHLYGSYMEALTGLSTIRAFRTQDAFIKKTEALVDTNNSAYFLTIAAQRWLSIRMDFLGSLIILALGLIAVGYRSSASPSTLGVALTYALSITQSLSQMVQQLAQLEQDMNTVERVIYYSDLPSEGDFVTPNDPDESWPSQGQVEFKDVSLRYRPELPLVLNSVSFKFNAGERIGVVGRTGSGKSTLIAALFATVRLSQGQILIDGVDISTIGLDFRKRLAICPQDAVIFDATLRENLSPDSKVSDHEMYAALKAVGLLTSDEEASASTSTAAQNEQSKTRFHLDLPCREDSFSAGQRQLIGLCRALIKKPKILVLDEATAATDVESDSNIQHMIQALDGTIITIAHRLDTVVFYDRVLVMAEGRVAELDQPLALFDREDSIFRSMCDQASLTRERIVKIRETAAHTLANR